MDDAATDQDESAGDSGDGDDSQGDGDTGEESPMSGDGDAPGDGDGDDPGDGDAMPGDGDGDGDAGFDGGSPASDVEPLPGFRHARRVMLDTSESGANVMDDVPDYPLALRLEAESFDFAQARAAGEDLRFTSAEGTPLPHSIEAWRADEGWAAVWVKLDVRGNDATQHFVMHWGNDTAEDESDGNAVFSVEDGFIGVYHLGDDAAEEVGGFKDATENQAHATGVNLGTGAAVPGRVGDGVALQHSKKQRITVDGDKNALFDEYERLTYSIWTYAESHTVNYQCAFSKGEKGFRLHYYGSHEWDDNKGKHIVEMCAELEGGADFCPLRDPPSEGTDVAPGKWFHWVAVHDYPRVTLYLNGQEEASGTSGVEFTSGAALPVTIGSNSSYGDARSWDGMLDEARVMKVAKGASWAKLEYESQREGQPLVRLGPVATR